MNPYIPTNLPITALNHRQLLPLVGKANAELAEYNGLVQAMINPHILLSPLTNQEAILSSQIEGTQATFEEVLEHEAGKHYSGSKEQDIQEILNYRTALMKVKEYLTSRPFSLSLILELHKILMDSARGQNKEPGNFRKDQNWIGSYGSTIEEATFVPPSPLKLHDCLENWKQYFEADDIDPLIQAAVMHAQFELIHPFKDGNGRIGRLLIPLFLFYKNVLSQPTFYISAYLEKYREKYYDYLQAISQKNDWDSWIQFFLEAIIEQARDNKHKATAMIKLYDEMKEDINRIQFLDSLFRRPIFTVKDLSLEPGIKKSTVRNLLNQLKKKGVIRILHEGAGRSPTIWVFPELLNIAEGRAVF